MINKRYRAAGAGLLLVIVFLMFPMSAFCQTDVSGQVSESDSIASLSEEYKIPVKYLVNSLEVQYIGKDYSKTLKELGIDPQTAMSLIRDFETDKETYLWSIVLIGMVIVFASLSLTAFIISMLKHVHIFDRLKAGHEKEGTGVNIDKGINNGKFADPDLAAALSVVVLLHQNALSGGNSPSVTWKRSPSSMWRGQRGMPNAEFFNAKRRLK